MKNNQKTRVVLDTNVLVSALVFGGIPREVSDLISQKRIRPVMSEELMTELRRIITTKFPGHTLLIAKYEKLLKRYAIWVPLGSQVITICRDPDDNKVIETAVLGNAQYILSGDKDLLVLKHYKNIRIARPAEFLAEFIA